MIKPEQPLQYANDFVGFWLEFFLLPRGFINDSFVWPLNNLHYCKIKGISPQIFGWLNFFNWSRPLNNQSNAQELSSLMNENSWIGELIKWQDWWLISILQLFSKLISNHPNVSLIDVLVHHLLIIFYLSKSQVILVMICYLAKAITLGIRLWPPFSFLQSDHHLKNASRK